MSAVRHAQRAGTSRSRRRAYYGSYNQKNAYKPARRRYNVGRLKGTLLKRGKAKTRRR